MSQSDSFMESDSCFEKKTTEEDREEEATKVNTVNNGCC